VPNVVTLAAVADAGGASARARTQTLTRGPAVSVRR
jgi:hypothetical protein